MTDNRKRVLIVEDEQLLLEALREAFTQEGFEVLIAADGEEGLKLAVENHPDLILLDIVMPKMDGIAMLGRLRDDAWGVNVPVVILSNLSDYTSVANALSHGVHEFLVKSNWDVKDVIKLAKEKLKIT